MFLHDYAVTRAGPSAVSQWTLYACTTDSYPCTDWAAISQSSLTSAWPGAVPVHVTSDLNRPSRFFRMALQGAASGEDRIVVQEVAVSLSGLAVEAAMYPESVVTVGETVAIQPQPFEGDAVFAISPALPASLTLDAATGAIAGAGAGHFAANWNVYTVTRSLNGETKRFTLVLVDGRRRKRKGVTCRNADSDRGTAGRSDHAAAVRAALDGPHDEPQRREGRGRQGVDRLDGGCGGRGRGDRDRGVRGRVSKENIANTKK